MIEEKGKDFEIDLNFTLSQTLVVGFEEFFYSLGTRGMAPFSDIF